jgi:LuxR family maltose regulon positive regulatory protein
MPCGGDSVEIDLLATKVRIPPPAPHAVPRPRLLDALETGVPVTRLTLLATPPGYGKTTLLAQWSRATALPVAWLTVDEGDNDTDRFLRYVMRALESIQPELAQSRLGVLLSGQQPDRGQVLEAFVNATLAMPGEFAFVIDDAHLLTNPSIHEALAFLLDHLPTTAHLVLAARGDPPLALARRRARGELLELRGNDLAFTPDETRHFLGRGMGLNLAGDQVDAVNRQLEGWATGLQLVALTLHLQSEPNLDALATGRHRHVADYLTEEVLLQLPDEVRAFLLKTSILDRLSASLCEAVTGNGRSQEMLAFLERANLFLMPLDDTRSWFRYQRVFADFLREALPRELPDKAALHSRAAAWCLANDLPEQAFLHALAARDIDLVSQVIDLHTTGKMFNGEVSVVTGWFKAIPPDWLASRPELMLAHAVFRIISGQPQVAMPIIDQLESLPRQERDDDRRSAARAGALRCFIACFRNDLPEAVAHAERAFDQLPPDDFAYRANLFHALGDTYRANGYWEESRANYLKVLELAPRATYNPMMRTITVHSYGALADLELRQGHLRAAQGYWTQALREVQARENWGHFHLPVSGWIHLRLGELAYERDDLDQARDDVARGFERAELGGEPQAGIAGRVILARLELTDGNLDPAAALLESASVLFADAAFPDWSARFHRCQVDLWLARGQWREALAWTESVAGPPLPEVTRLGIARVFVEAADPDILSRAGPQLDLLVSQAGDQGLMAVQIEGRTLRAMLRERLGDTAGALQDLGLALRLAEPEGYVRRFVDLGPSMLRLLHLARDRGVMPAYVESLVEAFGDNPGSIATPGNLVDPLSPREIDVLRLMASGLSNREIGEALFVSPETVKKHSGNIYGKLGVRGRVEAVTRARTLALID